MAITDKEQGVWSLDEVYNKQNQGGIWDYDGASALLVWGENNYGQLGIIDKVNRSSPMQLPGTTWDPDNISTLGNHSLFRKTDSTLWSVGAASWGTLGHNAESVDQSSPMQIPGTTWSSLVQINSTTVSGALKSDGTLWLWGKNQYGVLGQNQAYSPSAKGKSSPSQIPGTTWSSASMAYSSCGALKTNGELWTWGDNSNGRLGLNESQFSSKSSPVQLPGTWVANVANGASTGFGWKSTTDLWSWGYHGRGTLGHNDIQSKSSPVQIPGSWPSASGKFSSHFRAAAAVKTDGTLWIWGWNNNGQLGLNETGAGGNANSRSSPTQIPGTNWNLVELGTYSSFATKTDGTLWSWGSNSVGGLGLNDKTQRSSPTQVPGAGWIAKVNAGSQATSSSITL